MNKEFKEVNSLLEIEGLVIDEEREHTYKLNNWR